MDHKKLLSLAAAFGFAASLAAAPAVAQEEEGIDEQGVEQEQLQEQQPEMQPEEEAKDLKSIEYDQLDVEGTGEVSEAQFIEHGGTSEMFEKADANGDGVLSREEFEAAQERGEFGR